MVAKVVDKLAPTAIKFVLAFVIIAIISTIRNANIVLDNCSIVCDLAVTCISLLPLKYPLNTEIIETKNIAGDKATKHISASGIYKM